MKNCIALCFLLFVTPSFASNDEHFDPALEKSCQQEAFNQNCGAPKDDSDKAFMACIEGKMSSFSKDCQVVHQRMVNRYKEISGQ